MKTTFIQHIRAGKKHHVEDRISIFFSPRNPNFGVRVRVFNSKKEMLEQYNREVSGNLKVFSAKALMLGYNNPKHETVADIFLAKGSITPGVIAHEVAHAVIAYCRCHKVDLSVLNNVEEKKATRKEEWFVSRIDTLVDQAHVGLNELGIKP